MSARSFRTLALLAAALGLACAAVNAWFFTLGLQRLELDAAARAPMLAAGILMVVTEHAAFGLAALLPRPAFTTQRRLLVTLGALLLAFEVVTMFSTQAALAQTASAATTAHATRVQTLGAAVNSRRAAIDALRTTGELQAASGNSWTRHLGAQTLRQAMAAEAELATLTSELSRLQAATAPTLAGALGDGGVVLANAARAALIGGMGLLMLSAAGAMWAAAAGAPRPQEASATDEDKARHRSAPVQMTDAASRALSEWVANRNTSRQTRHARDAPRRKADEPIH